VVSRVSKSEYFLQILDLVASRSTCKRRAVGAIITDEEGHILSTGYNGVPRGFDHCIDVPCSGAGDRPGDSSNCMAVHAETNALLQCSDLERARILYSTCVPCFGCAKSIANTKIKTVIAKQTYADTRGMDVLLEAGIVVEVNGEVYGRD